MLRVAFASIALLFVSLVVAAPPAEKVVNLNAPGAMQALERSNPAHHKKIVAILEGVTEQKIKDVPKWLQTAFDARSVQYTSVLLVSDPPKRDLSFVLDDTRYRARVTFTHFKPELIDAATEIYR